MDFYSGGIISVTTWLVPKLCECDNSNPTQTAFAIEQQRPFRLGSFMITLRLQKLELFSKKLAMSKTL